MRRALTKVYATALLVLAVALPRLGHAADGRPVLRVVLVTRGDAPPWFEGFERHLERELGLRGIDVAIVRSERDSASHRTGAGSGSTTAVDAELVVEVPSALRPVLRFSVPPRDDTLSPEGSFAGRVRQVNLATVPADGCALALAAAADELMRSNWSRAVPAEATEEAKAGPEGKAASERKAGSKPGDKPASTATAASGEGASAERDAPSATVRSSPASEGEASAADVDSGADAVGPGGAFRWRVGLAAAVEAFGGGQTQVGPDLRWSARVLPRLEIEVRGGWRRILQQPAPRGVVDGSALAAGGALALHLTGGARASLSLVGRADVLRIAYSGEGRVAGIGGKDGSGFAVALAAGPRGRIAFTRSFAVEGELLAGASPLMTTATDDAGLAVISTNGALVMGSLGLSLGP